MKNSPPAGLVANLQHALDPCAWARDVLDFRPDPWQADVLSSGSKRLLLNNCRQSGKSTVCGILAAHTALFTPGALSLMFSPTLAQSAELFGKSAAVFKAMTGPPVLETDNMTSCTLANGSRIKSLPGKSDSARGYSAPNLVLVDEAGYVDDGLVLAILPLLAVGDGRLILMSTPNGRRGAFYHAWLDQSEPWERVMVPATDCPRITRMFLETQRAKLSPAHFDQEYGCQFLDAASQMFAGEFIAAAVAQTPALDIHITNSAVDRWSAPALATTPEPDVELPGKVTSLIVAVDVGQQRDPSAIVVLERREVLEAATAADLFAAPTRWSAQLDALRGKTVIHHNVVWLSRLILGTPYPAVVDDVASIVEQLQALTFGEVPISLWIVASGVGRGIGDLMEDRGLEPHCITITGGSEATFNWRRDIRVPKVRLVGALQMALQTYRLKVSNRIPSIAQFITEMEGFTLRTNTAGSESMEAFNQATHDDIVMAAAIGIWGAENPFRRATLQIL